MNQRRYALCFALLTTAGLGGCGERAADKVAPVAAAAIAPAPATPAANPANRPAQAVNDTPAVVVMPDTCQALIASYARCIDEAFPEADRELLRAAFIESRAQWEQAAASATTEATQSQLGQACRQSQVALRTQMEGYGCIL